MTAPHRRIANTIADLREQHECTGQFEPRHVDLLLTLVESTIEPPDPTVLSFPGPRPSPWPRGDLAPLTALCRSARLLGPGVAPVRCGRLEGHGGDVHRAYGRDHAVLAEWPIETGLDQ